MSRLALAFALLAFAAAGCRTETPPAAAPVAAVQANLPTVTLYKTPTCGCCALWGDRMRDYGFPVEVTETEDLAPIRAENGVINGLASCHTALVDGYVIEGHVPPADVARLLTERPAVRGLAVPGMPVGSPGMEVEGVPAASYQVYAFRGDSAAVFATH